MSKVSSEKLEKHQRSTNYNSISYSVIPYKMTRFALQNCQNGLLNDSSKGIREFYGIVTESTPENRSLVAEKTVLEHDSGHIHMVP